MYTVSSNSFKKERIRTSAYEEACKYMGPLDSEERPVIIIIHKDEDTGEGWAHISIGDRRLTVRLNVPKIEAEEL